MEYKTILIVDDHPENLQTIADVFTKENLPYQVIKVPNGEIALKIIEKEIPDLIITDWEMPVLDGIELIKRLKSDNRTIDVPVIMCTGVMTSSDNLYTALEAGAVDYIRKPVDEVELIARTKANLHLAENYKKIKELNQVKDNFFSIVSHDLRSPLGNIKSTTEMILDDVEDFSQEEIIEFLKSINQQSGSIFDMFENLLSWVNNQRKNLTFDPKYQSISRAVESNIKLLEKLASSKKINIKNNVDPSIKANFDLVLISTVVRNLLSNAIKFTDDNGLIEIGTETNDNGHYVYVKDSGVGIDAARINSVFEKTVFDSTYGTNSEKGTGLGLKISREFIEKHNGKIWVESELGVGSKFCFTIPEK